MNKIFHFWAKKPESDSSSSIEYFFKNQGSEMISLGFLEEYKVKNGSGFGPVCTVYFTESQLVEFIIEAEKALKSIQGK